MKKVLFACSLFGLFISCNNAVLLKLIGRQSNLPSTEIPTVFVQLDTLKISAAAQNDYRLASFKATDLIDTKLAVSFDWNKRHLLGKATIKLQPHFYPSDSLLLDAKGLTINRVALLDCEIDTIPLTFTYDSLTLKIRLNKTYVGQERYVVFIEYVAKPYERTEGLGRAISSDRGLFFINADGKLKNKPRQIWTQGETESASCWFPTIDKPNQKSTQTIYITRPSYMESVSNGVKKFIIANNDSTETDVWQMNQPHAPYLFMMAIGEFSSLEQDWRGIPVSYFIDIDYQEYVEEIFGKTPAMMECFSKKLMVNYPWPKYAQVVVHDYVSGAMENTSATIHGEFLQQTSRELADKNHEDVISHELFHQWFGDLVTAESWSNLALNESFASYGEYIWEEYAYGKEQADIGLENDLQSYLSESKRKQVPLVRYHYDNKDDMFDRHTYQKGACLLNQLRNMVGDSAFFYSLKHYLTNNAYKSAEVADLRLSFEAITGLDLSNYFTQWFYSPGHPKLTISYEYSDSLKKEMVHISQTQAAPSPDVYIIPMRVAIYTASGVIYKSILLNKRNQTFSFACTENPLLVNVDADKVLVGEKVDNKSISCFKYQYTNAPLFKDKLEALTAASKLQTNNTEAKVLLFSGLKANNYALRSYALDAINLEDSSIITEATPLIIELAKTEKNNLVRAAAIKRLGSLKNYACNDLFEAGCKDSSIAVVCESIKALNLINPLEALKSAYLLENDNSKQIGNAVAKVYGDKGTPENYSYFETRINNTSIGFDHFNLITQFGNYLYRMPDYLVEKGMLVLNKVAQNDIEWHVRMAAYEAIRKFRTKYLSLGDTDRALVVQGVLDEIKSNEKDPITLELMK